MLLSFSCNHTTQHGGRQILSDHEEAESPSATQDGEQSLTSSRIRPGFVLAVKVEVQGRWEVDEQRVRVSNEGEIRLPLIGSVRAVDHSLNELNKLLTELYGKYYVSPLVTLDFVIDSRERGSPWGSVTVLGRVKNPGVVALPPTRTLSLIAAIQEAGGFDTSADQRNIRITSSDNTTRHINLRAMGRRGQMSEASTLADGDIVYVPERWF